MEILKTINIKKELINKLESNINIFKLKFKIALDDSFCESVSYVKMITNLLIKLKIPYEILNLTYTEKDYDFFNTQKNEMFILSRPLKKDEKKYISLIKPYSDVDMISTINCGKLYQGNTNYLPATSTSVKLIIEKFNIDVQGKKVMILGRSLSVGLPCFMYFQNRNATATLCHSKTTREQLKQVCSEADIIILATGKQNLLDREWFNDNQIVIDCGYNENGFGDLGFIPQDEELKAYTPVPGGVGPLTIVSLIINALYLIEQN